MRDISIDIFDRTWRIYHHLSLMSSAKTERFMQEMARTDKDAYLFVQEITKRVQTDSYLIAEADGFKQPPLDYRKMALRHVACLFARKRGFVFKRDLVKQGELLEGIRDLTLNLTEDPDKKDASRAKRLYFHEFPEGVDYDQIEERGFAVFYEGCDNFSLEKRFPGGTIRGMFCGKGKAGLGEYGLALILNNRPIILGVAEREVRTSLYKAGLQKKANRIAARVLKKNNIPTEARGLPKITFDLENTFIFEGDDFEKVYSRMKKVADALQVNID